MIEATDHRELYDPVTQTRASAGLVKRSSLNPGDGLVGPAIIIEEQTTTIIGDHHLVISQPDGTLRISRTHEGASL